MNNTRTKIDWTLLAKYISGNTEKKEKAIAESMIKNSNNIKEIINDSTIIWKNSGNYKNYSFDANKAWKNFINRTQFKESAKKRLIVKYWKVAASIVILIGLSYATYFYLTDTIKIESGNHIKQLVLSDGTKIDLNKHSIFVYPRRFKPSVREVKLIKGEAFFEVYRNPKQPFIIKTEIANISVLGTSFNVQVMPAGDLDVTVADGKVAVHSKISDQQVVLHKNEKAILDHRIKQLIKMPNDNINYLAWKTRMFVFKETSLQEVYQNISKVYDVHFEIADSAILNYKLTAVYNNLPLDNLLRIIDRTFQLNSQLNGNQIIVKRNK